MDSTTAANLQPLTQLTVSVPAQSHAYPILIGAGLLSQLADWIRQWVPKAQRVLVVTDETVGGLYGALVQQTLQTAGYAVHIASMPVGEAFKTLETVNSLYQQALDLRLTRKDVMVALGGGIVGDVTGYVAATFLRGVPFVQVPTTLLAQVDSSVGGKVAINHQGLKNMIGAFYHPQGVLIDTETLETLSARDFACGMAEVIKYAGLEATILGSLPAPSLFETLQSFSREDSLAVAQIIRHCCTLKAHVVAQDPEERLGFREILNLGHTFAHAYETLSQGEILHGEAVSMGLLGAYTLAELSGTCPEGTADAFRRLLLQHGLPVAPCTQWPAQAVIELMQQDKKVQQAGQLRFVLPQGPVGQVAVRHDIPEAAVHQALSLCQGP